MNRYLLLILLTSWSLLITHLEGCDTGVAFPNNVLSVQRSSLANADVALLESYNAKTVEKCMEDCCSAKYGACTVASFKKNAPNATNCLHFNCRPLKQCKFLSSTSTDSFTFSSEPRALHPVPSSSAISTSTTKSPVTTPNAKSQFEQPHAVEEIATFSEEQADLKNDNTSVKPRKGVTALTPDLMLSKSGIKPRKGVTLEDVPHSKYLLNGLSRSNVKPRKGVGLFSSSDVSDFSSTVSPIVSNDSSLTKYNSSDDISANELVSELAKLFEDDPLVESSTFSHTATLGSYTISPTSTSNFHATPTAEQYVSSEIYSSYSTNSLLTTSHYVEPSFSSTPALRASSVVTSRSEVVKATAEVEHSSVFSPVASTVPLLSAKAHLSMDEPKSMDKTLATSSEETENDRKYKSSIHLVLSLVFGLLVLFAVLGVVAKRMYDGWQRRDYYRMNYLIDGIYNGYE